MKVHPLRYYFKLIENGYINEICSNFYDEILFYNSFDPDLFDIDALSWDEAQQAYLLKDVNTNEVLQTYTLQGQIGKSLWSYETMFKAEVREYLITNVQNNTDNWCKILQKEISILINKCKNIQNGELVIKSLEGLDYFLSQYTSGTFTNTNYEKNSATIKLKWQGKINTLVTLFFDLSQDTNNLKTKFIEYNRQELTDFIVNSFTDKEGKDIEESTVYRILDANPYDLKKAKNRIEINEQ